MDVSNSNDDTTILPLDVDFDIFEQEDCQNNQTATDPLKHLKHTFIHIGNTSLGVKIPLSVYQAKISQKLWTSLCPDMKHVDPQNVDENYVYELNTNCPQVCYLVAEYLHQANGTPGSVHPEKVYFTRNRYMFQHMFHQTKWHQFQKQYALQFQHLPKQYLFDCLNIAHNLHIECMLQLLVFTLAAFLKLQPYGHLPTVCADRNKPFESEPNPVMLALQK